MTDDPNKKRLTTSTAKSNAPMIAKTPFAAPVEALRRMELTKGLPPATIVYGVASGILFALSLCFLIMGHFVNGFLVLLPAFCFLGYAMYFMKYGQ